MKAADDALAVLARYRAALGLANRTIVKTRECMADVREHFAEGR